MAHDDVGHSFEAYSLDLPKQVTAICLDRQERYVAALEGGDVYRLKKTGDNYQFKLIFKSS